MALTPKEKSGARVVVLGGGNGTSRLLEALLPLLLEEKIASLHALIHTADDGGSTGRLREQYDVGSLGDLTKSLLALSPLKDDIRGRELLAAMNYRFSGGDMKGHTLRNILLAVFELTSPEIDSAIAIMARLVQIPKYSGVIPITQKAVTQQVELNTNGEQEVLGTGEHFIAHNVDLQKDDNWNPGDVRVTFTDSDIPINDRAREALEEATHIVVAPGHTYGTILPALALPALEGVIKASDARLVVAMPLLTTPRQTSGWSGEDFVRVYESYLGRTVDVVVQNTGRADIDLVDGQDWVEFQEENQPYNLIEENIVSTEEQVKQTGDTVSRAIVIHDAQKVRDIFTNLLE